MTFRMILTAALMVSTVAATADSPPASGHLIVARTAGDALLIWDASVAVASIVNDKASDADADARLQHDALHLLSQSLNKLDASAKSVTLRIVYNKIGAVSPVYGAATLADVERYATLTAAVRDLRDNRDKWRDAGPNKALPSWITYKVNGRLPPR